MAIETKIQDKRIDIINQLIEDAKSTLHYIEPTKPRNKLTTAREQLEQLAIVQSKNISEYPQYSEILTAENYLINYHNKYH